ncbi:DNA-binding HxlR family transcriptional regulator [Pseudomonas sp. BIGb0278]|uniref:winged helix-turn-helix transcriptional regulator n=1 Tax=Pseudomonas sp. BIGb0278 TaxID=2940607 RepID=UPI0021675D92|nr:helix-turn-helix domain-containing protein [Pseudomonas sp. BIGb0278]MCS4286076.1 DNA-binding HxlR family transcriptional regulator [Pseudomonas sp. BIGb0278]
MLDPINNQCPVARALLVLGDRWALMILRDAFDGLRRFSELQKSLGLAKNILSSRLKLLVETGLLTLQPASDGSAYKEYALTDKGRAVFPIVIGLRQWGEQFLFEAGETRSQLLDSAHGQPLQTLQVQARDGRVVGPDDCLRRVVRHGVKPGRG